MHHRNSGYDGVDQSCWNLQIALQPKARHASVIIAFMDNWKLAYLVWSVTLQTESYGAELDPLDFRIINLYNIAQMIQRYLHCHKSLDEFQEQSRL